MRGIELKNGRLLYYGNPAGYQAEGAVVADPMFQREDLSRWLGQRGLAVRWEAGVYERLSSGQPLNAEQAGSALKLCRIWQLGPEAPVEARFLSLERMTAAFGPPDPARYRVVYDGCPGAEALEDLWDKFSHTALEGGHPLSISDVVELYDGDGSTFFYCDRTTFRPIDFTQSQEKQGMTLKM